MMSKTYLSVILVGLGFVLLGLGIIFYRSFESRNLHSNTPLPQVIETTPTPFPQNEAGTKQEEVVIMFDGIRFSPADVSIKKGTAVHFKNTGTSTMWVASAVHPTHGVYPEFDQKTTSNEYTFIFDKVGNWKYHNHDPFVAGGTVSVSE
jgi:plastocyanin